MPTPIANLNSGDQFYFENNKAVIFNVVTKALNAKGKVRFMMCRTDGKLRAYYFGANRQIEAIKSK